VVTNSSGGETGGPLVTTAHERLSPSAARVLPVGREEDFSLVGDSGQKSGPRLGRNWTVSIRCKGRRTRWDAMNTTSSCLRMRLKARPSLV